MWVPAKLLMFQFIPTEYWGTWCSFVSFVWGIFLAILV